METILKQNRPGWRHDAAVWLGVNQAAKRNIIRLLTRDFKPESTVENGVENTQMVLDNSYFDQRNKNKMVARQAHPFWTDGQDSFNRVVCQLHAYGYIKKTHLEVAYNLVEELNVAHQNYLVRL